MTRSKIIEKLREEERNSFIALDPVSRVLEMERLLYEVIALKAEEEGVSEREIYNRYIERDKRRRHAV